MRMRFQPLFLLPLAFTACAEPAPELPEGTTMADVTFSPAGDLYVNTWCMTCEEQPCPGPTTGACGGGNPGGGGGGPPPHHYCPPPHVHCEGP
jgi:hypothetical protein